MNDLPRSPYIDVVSGTSLALRLTIVVKILGPYCKQKKGFYRYIPNNPSNDPLIISST